VALQGPTGKRAAPLARSAVCDLHRPAFPRTLPSTLQPRCEFEVCLPRPAQNDLEQTFCIGLERAAPIATRRAARNVAPCNRYYGVPTRPWFWTSRRGRRSSGSEAQGPRVDHRVDNPAPRNLRTCAVVPCHVIGKLSRLVLSGSAMAVARDSRKLKTRRAANLKRSAALPFSATILQQLAFQFNDLFDADAY
jgi:hypothetical protein